VARPQQITSSWRAPLHAPERWDRPSPDPSLEPLKVGGPARGDMPERVAAIVVNGAGTVPRSSSNQETNDALGRSSDEPILQGSTTAVTGLSLLVPIAIAEPFGRKTVVLGD
jgi:hypothetical protein